jgi:hypothetical protein
LAESFLDPKWLELLKASRPQAAALSVACIVLLASPRLGLVNSLPEWLILPVLFVGVLSAGLTIFSLSSSAYKFFPLHIWFLHYRKLRLERDAMAEYIPHMGPKEREIISYLLHHNQKTIMADLDGGYAAPLISRRILVRALQPGQAFSQSNTPFIIEDHIWGVLMKHKDSFQYKAPKRDEAQGHPWRIPWMAR